VVERLVWAPGINGPDQPSTARIRDYWLGGTHNTEADREVAEQVMVGAPHLPYSVRVQRAFLRRAVRHLAESGVRQFLDLGSGLPTAGNVHETAKSVHPDCRVLYVDVDPVVVAESRDLLVDQPSVAYAQADLRKHEQVFDSQEFATVLDPRQPTAVLLVDILHFVSDLDHPAQLVRSYLDRLPDDSYLVISHITSDDKALTSGLSLTNQIYHTSLPPLRFRDLTEIAELLLGLELISPGLVPIPLWNPEPDDEVGRDPEHFPGYAGVGRKCSQPVS
jgi:SAM-dependent methyltransferase